jgi:hypothetical protein
VVVILEVLRAPIRSWFHPRTPAEEANGVRLGQGILQVDAAQQVGGIRMSHDFLLERAWRSVRPFLLGETSCLALPSVAERVLVGARVHNQDDRGLIREADRLLLGFGSDACKRRSAAPCRATS